MYATLAIRDAIHFSLDHFLWDNALFHARSLLALYPSDDSKHLLALCFHRIQRPELALEVLADTTTPACLYLAGICATELKNWAGAVAKFKALLEKLDSLPVSQRSSFIDESSVRFCLGKAFMKLNLRQRAIQNLQKAVELNPFLWTAYELLCKLGENINASEIFESSRAEFYIKNWLTSISPDDHFDDLELTPPPLLPRASYQDFPSLMLWHAAAAAAHRPPPPPLVTVPPPAEPPLPHPEPRATQSSILKSKNVLNTNGTGRIVDNKKRKEIERRPLDRYQVLKPRLNVKFSDEKLPKVQTMAMKRQMFTRSLLNNQSNNQLHHKSMNNSADSKDKSRKDKKEEVARVSLRKRGLLWLPMSQPDFRLALSNYMHLLDLLGHAVSCIWRYQGSSALQVCQNIPLKLQESPLVLTLKARAYYEDQNPDEAIRMFQLARKRDKTYVQNFEVLSAVLWEKGNVREMNVFAFDLLRFNKADPETWCFIGQLKNLEGHHERALLAFQQALKLEPEFAPAHSFQGHQYLLQHQYDSAVEQYRMALKYDPRHYQSWFNLGCVYEKKEQWNLAESHYKMALELKKDHSTIHTALGNVYVAKRKLDLALEFYTKAVELDGENYHALDCRCKILARLGLIEESFESAQVLMEHFPLESSGFRMAGWLSRRMEDEEAAKGYFRQAYELDPSKRHEIMGDLMAPPGEDPIGAEDESLWEAHLYNRSRRFLASSLPIVLYEDAVDSAADLDDEEEVRNFLGGGGSEAEEEGGMY